MDLQGRIDKFKADSKNLFSFTERIMVALMDPQLFRVLMPPRYQDNPMGGYFALDAEQKVLVDAVHQGEQEQTICKIERNTIGKYLFIFVDGSINQGDSLTAENIQDCVDGHIDIVNVEQLSWLNPKRDWEAIPTQSEEAWRWLFPNTQS